MLASAQGMKKRGIDPRAGLSAPLGLAALMAITTNSTLRVLSGRGVAWKGRIYRRTPSGGTGTDAGCSEKPN
jgi:hypothetical protein